MDKDLKFELATDKVILKISNGRKVTNSSDFNLNRGSRKFDSFLPIQGGLYDGFIFGSMFENKCNCGKTRVRNVPCEVCGTMALDPIDRISRYGYYEMVVMYTSPIKIKELDKLIRKIFRINESDMDEIISGSRSEYSLFNWYYLSQFDYDKDKSVLNVSGQITDKSKVGLEGLESIIREYKSDKLELFHRYVNKLVPIIPAFLRRVKVATINGHKQVRFPKSTSYYRALIEADKMVRSMKLDDPYEYALRMGNLRLMASNVLMKMSGYYKSSKSTFMRANSYQARMNKSGRAVIVNAPELRIDQLGVPTFMCYEMMKDDWIRYMREVMMCPEDLIKEAYEHPSDKLMERFKEYAKTRSVLFNRPPTLLRYSIAAFKVVPYDDEVLHMPIDATTAPNADFDGDACMVYLVPEDMTDYVMNNASARNNDYYAYKDQPVYQPKHEVLLGLSLASKMAPLSDNPKEYVSLDNADEDYANGDLNLTETIQYGSQITTYGRAKLASIIGVSRLEDIIGEDYISVKNIGEVYRILNKYESDDKLDRIKQLDDFSLDVVTYEGSTTLAIKDLYREVPKEYRDRISAIMESDESDTTKIRKSEELYSELLNKLMNSYDPKFKEYANDTDRAKIGSIVSMMAPQFSIDKNGKCAFSDTSLIEGLSEDNYIAHAGSNREIIKAKALFVPLSGYVNRQGIELSRSLTCIKDKDDPDNTGIMIPADEAEGRTTLDGKVLGRSKSKDLVAVRSILGTKLSYFTPDMGSHRFFIPYDSDGRSNIGMAWISEFMQVLTQSGLAFKHSGVVRLTDPNSKLYAPVDTEVEFTDDQILIKANGTAYARPKVFNTDGNGFYKKGELIGEVPNYITAVYPAEALARLIGASGSIDDSSLSNKISLCDCYTGSKPMRVTQSSSGSVYVGKIKVPNDKLVMYPIGSEVPPFTRFTSGVQNMRSFSNASTQTQFTVFSRQVKEFIKANSLVLEVLYSLITENKQYVGMLRNNTTNNKSALSAIAYGYAKKALTRIVKGELNIQNENYTDLNISPVIINLISKLMYE